MSESLEIWPWCASPVAKPDQCIRIDVVTYTEACRVAAKRLRLSEDAVVVRAFYEWELEAMRKAKVAA